MADGRKLMPLWF